MAIILASASPRRRELLEMLGVNNLTIIPARGEEHAPEGAAPDEAVIAISRGKALEVAEQCAPGDVIIAADTIVCLDGTQDFAGRRFCIHLLRPLPPQQVQHGEAQGVRQGLQQGDVWKSGAALPF